jgi:hypothetical protein
VKANHDPAELPAQHGADLEPQLAPLGALGKACLADRVDDRRGGHQPGDDRQQDGVAHPDQSDQDHRQDRADNRAEVVHRALEPVGPAIRRRGDEIGQQGVAGRHPKPAREPGRAAQEPRRDHRARRADRRGKHRGGGVAADRDGATPPGVVGQRAAHEPTGTGEPLGDALDEPERRGRCPEGRGDERGHQRHRDLVPDVGQEARRTDPTDARTHPRPPTGRRPVLPNTHAREATRVPRLIADSIPDAQSGKISIVSN